MIFMILKNYNLSAFSIPGIYKTIESKVCFFFAKLHFYKKSRRLFQQGAHISFIRKMHLFCKSMDFQLLLEETNYRGG